MNIILPLILIIIGITILSVLIILGIRLQRFKRIIEEILELSLGHEIEINILLKKIESILKKIKIAELGYDICYLNQRIKKYNQNYKYSLNTRWSDNISNTNIYIEFYYTWEPREETKTMYKILLKIVLIIIRFHISTRQIIVNETFKHLYNLNTFILHDVKNIAQFIKFLSTNIKNLNTEEDYKLFINTIKEGMPILNIRANRIINFLTKNKVDVYEITSTNKISLKNIIKDIYGQYSFPLKIKGDVLISNVYSNTLIPIINNILRNIQDKFLEEKLTCFISLYKKKNKGIIKIIDTGKQCPNIDKIFAPFFTTKKQGLGIGLFEAAELIKNISGKITACNLKSGVMFKIEFPIADQI